MDKQSEKINAGIQNKVSIGRDANDNVIVSGDRNRIRITVINQGGKHRSEEPPESQKAEIGPNPYKGLSAFHEEDAENFFGREELTETLREKYLSLSESESAIRFIPILGPSGSGKSSVARAGLIPELARNPLPAMKKARVAVFVPGTHPIESLINILERIAYDDRVALDKVRSFEKEWRDKTDIDGLRRIVHALPDIADSPLVILVDQFEEIYSLCDDAEERKIFIGNLLHAAKDRAGRVSVVITLRSDFLAQTQIHSELSHVIAANSVIVPAMNEAQLRDAIAEPAGNAGHPIDTDTISLLIEQAGDHEGVLPLLEFALTQIWNEMASGIKPSETLKNIGGVGGALANEAGQLFDKLSDAEKRIAKRAFLLLVRLGEGTKDNRRRVPMSEITAHDEIPETVHKVLRKFSTARSRLITLSDGVAEITHEALFEHWLVLKDWLNISREDIRFQHKLSEAVGNWNETGKPAGLLWWQSPNLDLMKRFYEKNHSEMTTLQTEFCQASVGKADRAKWIKRVIAAVLVILTLFSAAGLVLTSRAESRALTQKELAMQAISQLTYEFADELAKLPGTQPILEKILKFNAESLDKIYALNPDTPEAHREKAVNHSKIGDVYLQLGNTDAAITAYNQAVEIRKKLAADYPKNKGAQRDLYSSLIRLGDIQLLQLGNKDATITAYNQALEISKKLAADDPKNTEAQRDLYVSYIRHGDIQLQLGNRDAAITAYNQSLEISKKLAADDPKNTEAQRDLGNSFERLGDIQLQLGNKDATITAYNQALEIRKKLAADDPKHTGAQRDLSVSYNKLGDIQLQLDNTDAVITAYNQSLEIFRKLAADDPKNKGAQRDLLVSVYKFGTVQEKLKNPKAALQYYQQALSIAEILAAQDKSNKQAQDDLAELKQIIEKLRSEL